MTLGMSLERGTSMTENEIKILENLGDAWNDFLALEELHSSEKVEFMNGIHMCQYILMSRDAVRNHPDLFHKKTYSKGDKVT